MQKARDSFVVPDTGNVVRRPAQPMYSRKAAVTISILAFFLLGPGIAAAQDSSSHPPSETVVNGEEGNAAPPPLPMEKVLELTRERAELLEVANRYNMVAQQLDKIGLDHERLSQALDAKLEELEKDTTYKLDRRTFQWVKPKPKGDK